MRRDSITLQHLDDRGHEVRAWCWTCARGTTIALYYCRRFADLDLQAAAHRFRCLACGSADQVALYPARRIHKMPEPKEAPDPDRKMTAADIVAAIFFGARKAAKQSRRDAAADRATVAMLKNLDKQKPAPKRVPTKQIKLRIVGTRPE